MNGKTNQYLTKFVKFLYTDLIMDTHKVLWNPIQETDQQVKISDTSKILTVQKIYRTTDSRVMIKTITEVLTDQIKSISFTVCSDTINLYNNSDRLTLAVLKLLSILDAKMTQINLARDTQSYINMFIDNNIQQREVIENED